MIKSKPVILVYTNEAHEALLKEMSAGIEEEGVLYETVQRNEADVYTLCYEAAKNSLLGVGVAIKEEQVAVQMMPLSLGKPLFELDKPTNKQARLLGMNAARAVKRMPFHLFDES